MLPDGEPRQLIARDLRLDVADTYGLIEELGRDCAGAVVIQPDEAAPPPAANSLQAEAIGEEQLVALIEGLRQSPLGVDRSVRLSLAGVQEKLLLTRMPDGAWGRPVNGTPSTHILKPRLLRFPDSVANEAFCMRLARHLGLPVANVDVIEAGQRSLLVVVRFDRVVSTEGSVQRVHQEDFCQALALLPAAKCQEDGGPSWRQIAEVLQASASNDSLEGLLRAMAVNVLLGNADAHGKNLSLVHEPSGEIRLAPLYDLVCTMAYKDLSLRMSLYIDAVQRLDRVTGDRMINEAASWGLSRAVATDVLEDLLRKMPAASEAALAETPGVPPELRQVIDAQTRNLQSTE